jgi:hypothetical protein
MTFRIFIFSILFTPFLNSENNNNHNSGYPFSDKINQSNKERIARAIVINMSNQDFEAATAEFTDTLKKQLTPYMLRGPWMSMVANAGAFTAIISTEGQRVEGVDQVVVLCQFENGSAVVQVIFNMEEKVTRMYLKPV